MASGQTLSIWTPHSNEAPITDGAYFDQRNGHLVLAFVGPVALERDQIQPLAGATSTHAIFPGLLPRNYGGGGVTLRICWVSIATTGTVKWNAQIDKIGNVDTDSFAAAQTVTTTAPGTTGALQYTEIVFTHGAQMDSLATGESFRLKITRDAADAGDNMIGAAQLTRAELRET